jgi:NADP-dependent 3-hydroxy acid dehydrogenase YdfG
MSMATLDGQVAWITGGGSGIGLAGAIELSKAGAAVVISGRRHPVLEEAAQQVQSAGGLIETMPVDVTQVGAVERVASEIMKKHGRLDILVNSAGLNVVKRAWADMVPADWDLVTAVNCSGMFYCISAVLPAMRQQRRGLIINIASWAGRYASKLAGPAYTASKHAVIALTHTLNMEEGANGVRACVICPGEVDTPLLAKRPVPLSAEVRAKMLRPEDLGRTIRFVSETPTHVCVNEIVISPVSNRLFVS